jgi:PTH1 family peptidyl-tRNA hydrolase
MKPGFVIIGLGNPGASYERTRHNVGWLALDVLHGALEAAPWKDAPRFSSSLSEGRIVVAPILLVKPMSYMNRSGEPIRKIIDFYNIEPTSVLVITDDADLSVGQLRLRLRGGAGTHNGLKSVVQCIGEGFPRLRVGIGSPMPGEDFEAYVLSTPPKRDREMLEKALRKIPGVVKALLLEGEEKAQNYISNIL